MSLETLGDGTTALTVATRAGGDGRKQILRLVLSSAFTGGYQIDRELGAGAMGAVFAGTQLATGRAVAIKFMLLIGDVVAAQRFAREARLMAKIQHPGVLRVVDVGELDGHPYLVTDLLPGGTLRERLQREVRLPISAAVNLAVRLLEGLDACHAAGIVHRDLKPENVMFDAQGAGVVVDLGIARLMDDAAKLTRTGAIVGTPRYMAPESWAGLDATPATDLFAIGAMLHECLAGRHPFEAAATPTMLTEMLREGPPKLSEQARVSPALEEVVARALAHEPQKRPASAARMAEELRAAGITRPPSRARSPRSLSSSVPAPGAAPRRIAALSVGAVAALIALALGVFAIRGRGPVGAGASASAAPVASTAENGPSAAASVAAGPPPGLTLDAFRPLPAGAQYRVGDAWLRAAVPAEGEFPPCALDATGRRLAAGGRDGRVRVWDLERHALVASIETGAPVTELAFVYKDAFLAVAHELSNETAAWPLITLWDLSRGQRVADTGGSKIRSIASLGGGKAAWIGVGPDHSVVMVQSLESADPPAAMTPLGRPRGVRLSADGLRLLVLVDGGAALVYDVAARMALAALDLPADVRSVAIAPDGATIAIARERTVEVLNAAHPNKRPVSFDVGFADHLTYAPGGDRIIAQCRGSAAGGGTVLIGLDGAGVRRLAAFPAAVAVAADREHAAFATARGGIVPGSLRAGAAPPAEPPVEEVLAVSPAADQLLVAGPGGVRISDLAAGHTVALAPQPERRPLCGRFGSDSKLACVLGGWDAPPGQLSRAFARPDGQVASRWAATGGHGYITQLGPAGLLEVSLKETTLRRAADGKETWHVDLSPSATSSIIADPGVQWFVRSNATIWDTASRATMEAQAAILRGVDNLSVGFASKERRIAIPAAIGWDAKYALVVDRASNAMLLILARNGKIVRSFAHPTKAEYRAATFSPEGLRVAVAYADGTIGVWEIPSCTLRRTFRAPQDPAAFLALDPRSGRMVSIGTDGTALVWSLDAP